MALNFDEIDIDSFLFAALPVRFQDTEPKDFENFISYLFKHNSYNLIPTSYSPDFSAHIIVANEGVKTAVQVRRYHEAHKVGVPEVHQIVAAQQYYNCQQAMVITTSSYQAAARELAKEHNVILWSWHRLEKAIMDTFLEGENYYDYFKNYTVAESEVEHPLSMQILGIEFNESEGNRPGTLVKAEITNDSDEMIRLHCELPIYINERRKQFSALNWADHSFVNGVIHPQACVELAFLFNSEQLSSYHKNDRLILTLHLMPQGEKIMLEQRLKEIKQSCYLVTFCYGRKSQEYHDMDLFREHVLKKNWIGACFLSLYYKLGTMAIPYIASHPYSRTLLRPAVHSLVRICNLIRKTSTGQN